MGMVACTPTPATSSATSPAISWAGATGSSLGPVTLQSSPRGCSTSMPSSVFPTRAARWRRLPSWAGNAAIVSSWVFYVDALFGFSHPSGMENFGIAVVGLWVPAVINLVGIRQMAWFQNITVVLKFLPLFFVGIVCWFFDQD